MAKRYIRVGNGNGWQNAPSAATPRTAENLNIMDKGIKDCDDAIGDLALLKTTAKADLVAAINEQNDNLGYKITLGTEYKTADTRDGKPVYLKYLGAVAQSGQKDVLHGIANADLIWIDNGNSFFFDAVDLTFYPPSVHFSTGDLSMWVNRGALVYYNTTPNVVYYHAVLRYTKTTD